MKKFRTICLFVFIVVLSIFVSGCSINSQLKKATESQLPSSKENNSSMLTESNVVVNQATSSSAAASSQTSNSQAEENFIGDWTISKFLASNTGGSTYDSETINKLIGKQLIFSKVKATCFGDDIKNMNNTVANPIYKKETFSNDKMYHDYRVTFKMLGITTDSLTQISTYDSAYNGCTFFVIDNDTLILTGGGDFFQLKRNN